MKKYIIPSVIAILLVVTVAGPLNAEAAIETASGTVKAFGSGLQGAKVSIEGINFWTFTTTNSGGTWSITTGSSGFPSTYYVDGMKQSYTHDQNSGYSGSNSGIINDLTTRSTITAKFKIAADEEFRSLYGAGWQSTAKDKLLTSESYFQDEHTISFADTAYYSTWDSQDGSGRTCEDQRDEAITETGWGAGTYSNSDILVIFSEQGFSSADGCVDGIPTSGGTHPAFIADNNTSNMGIVTMHEITHLYGFSHTNTCSNITKAIMNVDSSGNECTGATLLIKNWAPADDVTIDNNRRTWY